jgi:SAM-dependent methyltransferase
MQNSPKDHWNTFYKSNAVPHIPSQFGSFIANECVDSGLFVEFGCGNGRDSLLFLGQGKHVIAVDASPSAIDAARAAVSPADAERISFIIGSVGDDALWQGIADTIEASGQRDPAIYARFFIHAIDDECETVFLRNALAILTRFGGRMCLEFRTNRDESQTKWAKAHYRRYIRPLDFLNRLAALGGKVEYFVEGYGYAKFREDDAHVARVICGV